MALIPLGSPFPWARLKLQSSPPEPLPEPWLLLAYSEIQGMLLLLALTEQKETIGLCSHQGVKEEWKEGRERSPGLSQCSKPGPALLESIS